MVERVFDCGRVRPPARSRVRTCARVCACARGGARVRPRDPSPIRE